MINPRQRNVIRQRVHTRIREKMSGTAERPRLNVYRSLNHIYTQLIDDLNGVTLAAASSMHIKGEDKVYGGNVEAAKLVGKLIGKHSLIAPCWPLSPRTTTPDDLPSRLANSARSSNAAYRDEQSRESSPF